MASSTRRPDLPTPASARKLIAHYGLQRAARRLALSPETLASIARGEIPPKEPPRDGGRRHRR